MRWPWTRRTDRMAASAERAARDAEARLRRAHADAERVEAAAEWVAGLPAGELVRRLGMAFAPRREHD